jgi:hypothetical protein
MLTRTRILIPLFSYTNDVRTIYFKQNCVRFSLLCCMSCLLMAQKLFYCFICIVMKVLDLCCAVSRTRRPEQCRDTHLRIYRVIPATRGGKAHFMYAFAVETPRSGQARYAHLSSYRGNLKNVYACVLLYRSGARSYGENPNNAYVCVLYSRINARRTFTYLKWQPQFVVPVTYHPRVRRTKVYVLSFPAINGSS